MHTDKTKKRIDIRSKPTNKLIGIKSSQKKMANKETSSAFARFASKVNAVIHERNTHNKPLDSELIKSLKLLTCDVCGKVFMSKYHLVTHISSHTNAKHFPCDHCGKKFASRSNLKVHIKIHDGRSKMLRCPYERSCEKMFSHKSEVKQHSVSHSSKWEYFI